MSKSGYVYVLTNPCVRNPEKPDDLLVKIGSAVDYDNRMGSLNSAVPYDFVIQLSVLSNDCRGLEAAIHKELSVQRVNPNAEFFALDLTDAKDRVRKIAIAYCKERKLSRPVFETKIVQLGRAAATVRRNREALLNGGIRFVCSLKGRKAFGHFERKDAFVVEKGSFISSVCAKSFKDSPPLSYYARWIEIVSGRLDENGCLKEDEYFSSRAFAASVVCGSTRNGNREWIQENDDKVALGMYFGK